MCNPWGRSPRSELPETVTSVLSSLPGRVFLFAKSISLPSFVRLPGRLCLAEPSTMSTNGIIRGSLTQRATVHQQQLPASIYALVLATLVLGLAYAPNFRDLYSTWNDDPNYSHGKLVIPIALFILWRRLSETPARVILNKCVGVMVGLGLLDRYSGGTRNRL